MKKFHLFLFALFCLGVTQTKAQFTDILNFNGTNGLNPLGDVTISGNVLFGMTQYGGADDSGCIYTIHRDGSQYKDLLNFTGINGATPSGDLTLSGKVLYGMTLAGGAHHKGLIFSIDTNGSGYKDIYDFNGTDGASPFGSLSLFGKKLFGMTSSGGANTYYGDIFSIDTDGSGYKDLFDFNGTTGEHAQGSLILSGEKMYGMTFYGGINDDGIIFSIDTDGSGYKDLFDFDNSPNGRFPNGSLKLSGSELFGMTSQGSPYGAGLIFSIDTNGNFFKVLLDFSTLNGDEPLGSFILSRDVLYGMTYDGGSHVSGNIFSIDTNGNGYSNLVNFVTVIGEDPYGSLTLSGDTLYGMTQYGGTNGDGVIFSLIESSITTGMNKINVDAVIKLYPNPNSGKFTIQSSSITGGPIFEVYNVLGEKVFTETLPNKVNNTINIGSQPDGIYLYRAVSIDGNLAGEGKLIIQK